MPEDRWLITTGHEDFRFPFFFDIIHLGTLISAIKGDKKKM